MMTNSEREEIKKPLYEKMFEAQKTIDTSDENIIYYYRQIRKDDEELTKFLARLEKELEIAHRLRKDTTEYTQRLNTVRALITLDQCKEALKSIEKDGYDVTKQIVG